MELTGVGWRLVVCVARWIGVNNWEDPKNNGVFVALKESHSIKNLKLKMENSGNPFISCG
jgi:hypothetical protein